MEKVFWGVVWSNSLKVTYAQSIQTFWRTIHLFCNLNPPGHGGHVLNIAFVGRYIRKATWAYCCAMEFGTCSRILPVLHPDQDLVRSQHFEDFTEAFTKEMVPEGNIRGIVIQPGGFRTEWAKSSMVALPLPPQHDRPDAPLVKFRQLIAHSPMMGDPLRAAFAVMQIAALPGMPPRTQSAMDAVLAVRNGALKMVADAEEYVEPAHYLDEP